MNAHDVDMASLGAGAAEVLMLGAWWLAGIPQRREARAQAAARQAEIEDVQGRLQELHDQVDATSAKLQGGRL